jgi:hypothetical protein
MKAKYNKKRNTAFVYEALVREITASILKEDHSRRDIIVNIIKKHFGPHTSLKKDLDCYRSLYESKNLERFVCEKIIKESRNQKILIDPDDLFKQQTDLINDINKDVSSSVFGNFVPNYKTLASIAQIFSNDVTPKKRVMLESQVAEVMTAPLPKNMEDKEIDNMVYKTFVRKFNDKYDDSLLEEQKDLLGYYVSSFSDNAVQLKVFLNDEVARLKEALSVSLTVANSEDSEVIEKTNRLIGNLNNLKESTINDEKLLSILRTQSLVKEISTNVNND